MKGLFATVALIAVVATGCDSPVAPTALAGTTLRPQAAPFRNFGGTVPDLEQRNETCGVRSGCCFDRRPHRHCR